jgi:hypothetical protein
VGFGWGIGSVSGCARGGGRGMRRWLGRGCGLVSRGANGCSVRFRVLEALLGLLHDRSVEAHRCSSAVDWCELSCMRTECRGD